MTAALQRWLPFVRPEARPRARVVCFSYAGGSASIFRGWGDLLPPELQVCAVELPGHGTRAGEAPLDSLQAIVGAVVNALLPLASVPFVLFGHSMGGLVAYEVARAVQPLAAARLRSVHISSSPAPHRLTPTAPRRIDRPWVLARMRSLGAPVDPLALPDALRERYLSTLEADFRAYYGHVAASEPALGCPIRAWGGVDDGAVPRDTLESWRDRTTAETSLEMVPGDHFHLTRSRRRLTAALAAELR